jgi:four helix bundle protein
MEEFRFLDWKVYSDSKAIANKIFLLTNKFPNPFRFELGSQMNRSAISIVLNIAEGSAKSSKKDFSHFLTIAMGSLYETLAGLDLAKDNGLVDKQKFDSFKVLLLAIAKQIGGMKRKLAQ